MFHTYVLISETTGRLYKGSCLDLDQRIAAHNAGRVRSTKAYRPWRLLHVETFASRTEALKRERFLKSLSGWRWLKSQGLL